MQSIPYAIETQLKTQSAKGSNAPYMKLTFPSGSGSYDWDNLTTWRTPQAGADDGVSVAEKANGSLIWCWVASNTVYEGTVSDVDTLLGGDSTVTGATSTGITGVGATRACVFNLDGGLYLHVTSLGDSENNTWCKVYKSASGNGGDWALHGTLWDTANAWPDTSRYTGGAAGKAVKLSTGRWVMPTVEPHYAAHDRLFSIWTSDDGGVTWTRRHYYGNSYMTSHSRQVAVDGDGNLWWAIGRTYSGGNGRIYRSTDNGANWTYHYSKPGSGYAFGMDLLYIEEDEHVYLFCDHDSATAVRVEYFDDLSVDESTTYVTSASGNKDLPLVVEHSGGTLLICADDGVLGVPTSDVSVYPTSLRLQQDTAADAARLVAAWPNVNPNDPTDVGYYSPDRGDDDPAKKNAWYHVLFPESEVTLELGYGSHYVTRFKGQIDDTRLFVEPSERGVRYMVEIDCRDYGRRLVDLKVQDDSGNDYLTYESTTLEAVAVDLLKRAGWSTGNITAEETGRSITKKTFERQSYGDALGWILDASGFELSVQNDEISFYYPTDRQPAITNLLVDLTSSTSPVAITSSTGSTSLGRAPVVSGSEVVTSTDTLTTYTTGDYVINYGSHSTEANIARISTGDGGSIPAASPNVLLDYVYSAWSFSEGEDLFKLEYTLTSRNIYKQIKTLGGTSTELKTGTYNCGGTYDISTQKRLFIPLPELNSTAELQAAADRLGNDMSKKYREIVFAAVAIPWLEVGDCIQVIESMSTISEVYRILELEFRYENNNGRLTAIMTGRAYHYGYAPL